jgi:hypothetical protein
LAVDSMSREQTGQAARKAFEEWCDDATDDKAQGFMVSFADALLAELEQAERGWSEDDKEWREKLEQSERERDEALNERDGTAFIRDLAEAKNRKLEARLAKVPALVEALRWYGDRHNWTQPTSYETRIHDPESKVVHDYGTKARDALAVWEQE